MLCSAKMDRCTSVRPLPLPCALSILHGIFIESVEDRES